MAGHPLQQQLQFVDAERFGHVVIGAILHGLHRRLHGAVAGHHDDHSLGTAFLDAAQRIQASGTGQAQVEQDSVEGLGVEKPVSLLGGIGHMGA